MQWLSRSDTILLGVAVYFAVMALVRLMQRRRDELVADVQRQVDERRNRSKRPADDKPRKAA
jgi:uncharacterized membrane protein